MILIEEMRIYILNTTRFYHEDFEEYPGAWFSCPVDFEEIRERLGVQSEEEIEIEDYELPFPLEGNTRLWEINPFAGWYRKCRERPSIMKWMWYKSGGFPALRNLSTTKTRYAAIRCRTGNPSPVIWCRRYSYLEKYIQTC
ncbi:putative antirestriction protein [Clostridioides difficile Y266]|nr:putative antirestriction protein [Clostridioides difficile Y266]